MREQGYNNSINDVNFDFEDMKGGRERLEKRVGVGSKKIIKMRETARASKRRHNT